MGFDRHCRSYRRRRNMDGDASATDVSVALRRSAMEYCRSGDDKRDESSEHHNSVCHRNAGIHRLAYLAPWGFTTW